MSLELWAAETTMLICMRAEQKHRHPHPDPSASGNVAKRSVSVVPPSMRFSVITNSNGWYLRKQEWYLVAFSFAYFNWINIESFPHCRSIFLGRLCLDNWLAFSKAWCAWGTVKLIRMCLLNIIQWRFTADMYVHRTGSSCNHTSFYEYSVSSLDAIRV